MSLRVERSKQIFVLLFLDGLRIEGKGSEGGKEDKERKRRKG